MTLVAGVATINLTLKDAVRMYMRACDEALGIPSAGQGLVLQ